MVIAVVIVIIYLAQLAYAMVFSVDHIDGRVSIESIPIIWYGATGSREASVSLDSSRQTANASIKVENHALHVYDYNDSWGIIARRGFLKNTDFSGNFRRIRFQWDISGRLLRDPNGAGLVLGEVELGLRNGSLYWFSFYYYKDGTLHMDSSCSPLRIDLRIWHTLKIIVHRAGGGSKINVTWYVDSVKKCSIKKGIRVRNINWAAVQLGRYDETNMYDLYVDNVSILFKSRKTEIRLSENYEEGSDGIFIKTHGSQWWDDTYYTSTTGESSEPPPDMSVGKYIEQVFSGPVLYVYSNLREGERIESTLNLTRAICNANYTPHSNPIIVRERSGRDLSNYTIRLELNSTNFDGWSMIGDGRDVYFTDTNGSPLYYWVEYLNKTGQRAVIWVELPSLPAYNEETIYMHYGGINPYSGYNNPLKVFLFYDSFNYNSIEELLNSGKWVGVEPSYISGIENGVLNVSNGNHVFAIRTAESFNPPFTVEFSLAASRNQSSDWDSGIAVGWDNSTNYVAYLDDIGGNTGYGGNYLAITEQIDAGSWSNLDEINEPRKDRNWTAFHVYRVEILLDGDKFMDSTDGRNNTDEKYSNRNIVNNYGNISGYIWIVNDGDTKNNNALYKWIRIRKTAPNGVEPVVYILPRVKPFIIEYLTSSDGGSWSYNSVRVEGYTNTESRTAGPLNLTATSSPEVNLSRIILYASLPPGAGVACNLSLKDPYVFNPGLSDSPVTILYQNIKISDS